MEEGVEELVADVNKRLLFVMDSSASPNHRPLLVIASVMARTMQGLR